MGAHEPMYIACHRTLVITTGWTGGLSSAAIIGNNHAKTGLDKSRDYMSPFPPSLRKPEKKNDGATPPARRNVMQSHARLDVGHAMSQHRRSLQRDHSSIVCVIRHAAFPKDTKKPVPRWRGDCGSRYRQKLTATILKCSLDNLSARSHT